MEKQGRERERLPPESFQAKGKQNITRIGQACKSGQQTAICQPQATSYRHLRNKSIPKHSVILENNIHAHFHFPIFLPFNKKSLLEGKRNLWTITYNKIQAMKQQKSERTIFYPMTILYKKIPFISMKVCRKHFYLKHTLKVNMKIKCVVRLHLLRITCYIDGCTFSYYHVKLLSISIQA